MSVIKVGFLISYDYEFIKISLPRVYPFVSEIFLALDADRLTWAGDPLNISDDFWEWLKEFDVENKITIYQDQFFVLGLSPMECDTRERNMLAKKMGDADWYVQIDSDEYFTDFESFVQKLDKFRPGENVTITCRTATLFKKVPTGFLVVAESNETLSFASNNPVFELARNSYTLNKYVHWDDLVLHQSWARTSQEILTKLNNWSHKDDFNVASFYKLWNAVDEFNYFTLKAFHPFDHSLWPKLKFIPGDISAIINSEVLKTIHLPDESTYAKRKPLFSRLWKEIRSEFKKKDQFS